MSKKGFTLIEILVVVAIIGVLMGVLLVAMEGIRKAARDGKRKADLEQIRSALEMYRSDTGSYPASLGATIAYEGKTYLTVPSDPLSTYSYIYEAVLSGSTPISYRLCACLESGALTTNCSTPCSVDCGSSACNYTTCNP